MEVNWTVTAALSAAMLVVMLGLKQRADGRAWDTWRVALGDARRALADWFEVHTHAHLAVLGATLDVAREDHERRNPQEAARVMDAADTLAAQHVIWLRRCLTRWTDVVHARGVAWKLPPSPTARLELRPLRALARIERAADFVLPSGAWRLRLRRTALGVVGVAFAAATLRARRNGALGAALDDMHYAHADLVALDRQVREAFQHLLRALPEQDRHERRT